VDDKSGEDLTRQVLLQVIAEQEQFGVPVLNVPLLELVIRFYGSPLQGMLTGYLEQGIRVLTQQQQAMQAEMTKMLETPLAPLTELARQNMELWAQTQAKFLNAFGAPPSKPADEPPKKK
jgi:polyhydroxyalkanoate synthesis regulator protein